MPLYLKRWPSGNGYLTNRADKPTESLHLTPQELDEFGLSWVGETPVEVKLVPAEAQQVPEQKLEDAEEVLDFFRFTATALGDNPRFQSAYAAAIRVLSLAGKGGA